MEQKLGERFLIVRNNLCVGLDPNCEANELFLWCKRIIDATCHISLAYKPNIAYFEQHGAAGITALQHVLSYIPASIPVILDMKRADISISAKGYANLAYNVLQVDAVTVCGYMGTDAIKPFIRPDKGVFVLCHTSNESAAEIQDLSLVDGRRVYRAVADNVAKLGPTVGLVVGATNLMVLSELRSAYPNIWILCPGVGAQGANVIDTVIKGIRYDSCGLLINIGRGISSALDPKQAAENYIRQMQTLQN